MNNLTLKIQELEYQLESVGKDANYREELRFNQQQLLEESRKALKISLIYNYFNVNNIPPDRSKTDSKTPEKIELMLLNQEIKQLEERLELMALKLEEMQPKEAPIDQSTLIVICIIASFFLSTTAFLIAFSIMSKEAKVNMGTTTLTTKDDYDLMPSITRIPDKWGKQGRRFRGKDSKR
jgi:hypothetical protein